jgi:hypothetical protein
MAKITYIVNGNIARPRPEHEANHVVHQVNCVGGSGLYSFTEFYPYIETEYKARCGINNAFNGFAPRLKPGEIYVDSTSKLHFDEPNIIIAAVKDDWHDPSQYTYIVDILCSLTNLINNAFITSIALPTLGCSGCTDTLSWDEIGPLVAGFFEPIRGLNVFVYIKPGMRQYHIAPQRIWAILP